MKNSKYKAVIFDFDDTLVASRTQKWAHHKFIAKKFYNIDLTDETLRKHWGKPLNLLISELYQNADTLENMHEALVSVRGNFLKQPYAGSAEVVQKLLSFGLKIGILSATNKKYLKEDLTRFGFSVDKISIIQGADETLVHKPNPDVFIPILDKLKQLGIKKQNTVYIGDSLIDLQAAYGAGIDFIAVTTGLYSEKDFKIEGVKIVIKDIREVIEKII